MVAYDKICFEADGPFRNSILKSHEEVKYARGEAPTQRWQA